MGISPAFKSVLCLCLSSQLFFSATAKSGSTAQQDTTREAIEVDANEILYNIKMDRLRRLVSTLLKEKPHFSFPADFNSTINDAKSFAGQGDYDLACEFLDEALAYLSDIAFGSDNPDAARSTTDRPSNTQWSYLAYFGSDLWQQKFGIVFSNRDSTLFESQGNPFVGFRILMNRSPGPSSSRTLAELEGKISHDYNSGLVSMEHYQVFSPVLQAYLKNRFEATSYKTYNNLRYIDDRLNVGAIFKLSSASSFEVEDEVQLRKYGQETDFFTSFLQNKMGATLYFNPFGLARTEIQYQQRSRKHTVEAERDYDEKSISLSLWPDFVGSNSFYGRIQGRSRHYGAGYIDSLFTNDFSDVYGEINFRHTLNKRFIFRFDATFENRNYANFSLITPDYFDYSLQPSFTLHVGLPWSVRAGYFYRNRSHFIDGEKSEAAQIEDYFSHGPVLAFDVIATSGFVATLSNTMEFRRFPNAPQGNGEGISLYSNRTINSIFLFLTWTLSEHWELTCMGNMDYDDDKSLEGTDSRTNLFNVELTYKF